MTRIEILAALDRNMAELQKQAKNVQDAQVEMTKLRKERDELSAAWEALK